MFYLFNNVIASAADKTCLQLTAVEAAASVLSTKLEVHRYNNVITQYEKDVLKVKIQSLEVWMHLNIAKKHQI